MLPALLAGSIVSIYETALLGAGIYAVILTALGVRGWHTPIVVCAGHFGIRGTIGLIESGFFAKDEQRVVRASEQLFRVAEVLVSRRAAGEEFGDALEQLHELANAGEPAWKLQLKTISTIAWAVHSQMKNFRGGPK